MTKVTDEMIIVKKNSNFVLLVMKKKRIKYPFV